MSPLLLPFIIASLLLGTATVMTSSHWLLAWMGLEINTMAILPLMARNRHPRAMEATTKYFIIQATAAALLLFSTTSNTWLMGSWEIQQPFHPLPATLAMLALGLKVGLAPMHFWLPEVLQGQDLIMGLTLSTWQKLAPMALIYQLAPAMNHSLITTLGLLSILIGGWGGLNQTHLRKLLAYSSIAHMGWMMIVLKYAPNLMMLGLVTYLIMTTSAFMTLKTMSATKINTLSTGWAKAPTVTTIILTTMLSLGGLPPLTGFMPKWLILQELVNQKLPAMAVLAALAALLSLFFYLRICFVTALTTSPKTNNTKTPWRTKSKQNTLMLSIAATLTIMLLPMTPTLLMTVTIL
uniref:NADH-ubiquinone oxidoreductase chain 2 n=1 Tax=Protanguilla palau TaxID=1405575 RepID=G2HK28_9TELE|nr:NADH dehydrogenase subunit 2 [Protanguilla palau]